MYRHRPGRTLRGTERSEEVILSAVEATGGVDATIREMELHVNFRTATEEN